METIKKIQNDGKAISIGYRYLLKDSDFGKDIIDKNTWFVSPGLSRKFIK